MILIGGVLAIVFSVVPLASLLLLRPMIEQWMSRSAMQGGLGMQGWSVPMLTSWLIGAMTFGAIVTVVLGIIAIYAYTKVRSGKLRTGGTIAIIVAVILLVLGQWATGIITVIGGILSYTSDHSTPHQSTT